jgi:hypothetical protein
MRSSTQVQSLSSGTISSGTVLSGTVRFWPLSDLARARVLARVYGR